MSLNSSTLIEQYPLIFSRESDQRSKHASAAGAADEEYSSSVCAAVRSRLGWLALFLVGLWGAAFVIDWFEHMLQRNVELAHFVPLIIGHGGNAGSLSLDTRNRSCGCIMLYQHLCFTAPLRRGAVLCSLPSEALCSRGAPVARHETVFTHKAHFRTHALTPRSRCNHCTPGSQAVGSVIRALAAKELDPSLRLRLDAASKSL